MHKVANEEEEVADGGKLPGAKGAQQEGGAVPAREHVAQRGGGEEVAVLPVDPWLAPLVHIL